VVKGNPMADKKTKNKNIHHMHPCHDSKLKVKEGNKKVQGKNLKPALEVFNSMAKDNPIFEQNVLVSFRTKDDDGKWYFGVSVLPYESLKSGDEIILNKNKKLIVKAV
jgi:hypothetical protein